MIDKDAAIEIAHNYLTALGLHECVFISADHHEAREATNGLPSMPSEWSVRFEMLHTEDDLPPWTIVVVDALSGDAEIVKSG